MKNRPGYYSRIYGIYITLSGLGLAAGCGLLVNEGINWDLCRGATKEGVGVGNGDE